MSIRTTLTVLIAMLLISLGSRPLRADDQPPASQPAKVPPVDYHKLKDVMPEEMSGIKRSHLEGQKSGFGNVVLTQATAEYKKPNAADNDPSITIELIDYSSTGMGDVANAWDKMNIDQESDSGFERTLKIKDQPAFEQYQNHGKSGTVMIFIANRFSLHMTTTNLSADDFKKLAETLPVEKVAALK